MPPTVHHLNCASFSPPAGRVGAMPARLVAHVLLVEGARGVTLVDTGFGTDDVREGRRRLGTTAWLALAPRLDPRETAVEQVRALGHDPADVRDIVLTHLDLDHAGGLADFPAARVHLHAAELDAATHPTLRERSRYLPAQWAHGPQWTPYGEGGDTWSGFEGVSAVGDDVALVPLHGHTRGHSGVAVRRGERWLLHAGDAYFHTGDLERPRACPWGLRVFQSFISADEPRRRANLERLVELHERGEVTVFSAHDESELRRLQNDGGRTGAPDDARP